jgi:hypothetical protein
VCEEEARYFYEDYSTRLIDDTLSRLLTLPNVIVTSHRGFFTQVALEHIATSTLRTVRDCAEGRLSPNEVCVRGRPRWPPGRGGVTWKQPAAQAGVSRRPARG